MGFFSQDCSCGHPLLCAAATQDLNRWMTDVVAVTPNGSILRGEYDGYGRIFSHTFEAEDVVGSDNRVFHYACWEAEGKPTDYTGPSPHSADQGWFFDDDAHNWGSPAAAKANRPNAA